MGHINFDHEIETDWKGLIKFKSNTQNNFKWNIYNIPIKDTPVNWSTPASTKPYPCLLMGQITLTEVGDTYLDLSAYGKGYVWVNDHNLGRYWNIGPQQRVFCPGVCMAE